MTAAGTRRRDYPGWRMVWALAVTETISYASLFYCFAVMVVPMRADLDASTAQLSGALTLAIAVNGAAAIPVGRWLDRHGARWVMTAGSALGALSVAGWSQAQTLPQLYLAFAGMGLAGAAVLYEPAFAVVNTWFREDRNRALLTITVVAGFSSTVFLPLSQALVDRWGWRDAVLALAGLLGACAVPHALLLRRSPADVGLPVDGRTPTAPDDAAPSALLGDPAPPSGAAGRLPAVRWLTSAAVLESLAVTAVAVHLVAYLRDQGASASTAATAAGALGILSVTGRLALTAAARRAGLARVAAAMVGGQALGVVALLALPGRAGVPLFVLLFGAGFGVMTIARPALLGDYVPPQVFASVSGVQAMATGAGRVVAPFAAGVAITAAGYGVTMAAVALCSLAAAFCLLAGDRVRTAVPATAPA